MDKPSSENMAWYEAGVDDTLAIVSIWLNEARLIEIRERLKEG